MHEALDTPSLSLLTWDMPKNLLRIAVVLVLGPFVSTAKAKVMIQVDLDAQQMTVIVNNDETHVWEDVKGLRHRQVYSVCSAWTPIISPTNTTNRPCLIQSSLTGGWPCVRLAIPHARMLYSWVKQYGASIEINGTAIEILDPDPDTNADIVTERRRTKKRSHRPSNPSWIIPLD
jgi:hypothetical protein